MSMLGYLYYDNTIAYIIIKSIVDSIILVVLFS